MKKIVTAALIILLIIILCAFFQSSDSRKMNRICDAVVEAIEKKDENSIFLLFSPEAKSDENLPKQINKMLNLIHGKCENVELNSSETKKEVGINEWFSRTRAYYYVKFNNEEYILYIMAYTTNFFDKEKKGINNIALIPREKKKNYPNYDDNSVLVFIPS